MTNISEFTRQTDDKLEYETLKVDSLSPFKPEEGSFREIYPKDMQLFDDIAFFVEFHCWGKDRGITWQLFRRAYRCSKEEYLKECQTAEVEPFSAMSEYRLGGSVEVHPWNLGEGILVDKTYPNVVSLHTKKFLCYLVDALNEKTIKDSQEYRFLYHGEVIKEGDEFLDDGGVWRITSCAGENAPNPDYTSHRQYRRKIK